MLFRLSMAWGIPADVLAEQMTAEQLDWYCQFFRLEPWGTVADDHRTAIVAYTTAISSGAKGVEFSKFLPQWEGPREVSYEEGFANFRMWATLHNKQQGRANR